MIPELVDIGAPWKVLPTGLHSANLTDIEGRFAFNPCRVSLFHGFRMGVESLIKAGCHQVYLDGSFVTEKENPDDFDACWDPLGVDENELDPVLLIFDNRRQEQKAKYGGEFFPTTARADGSSYFLDLFQVDKHTGNAKGVISIEFHNS